MNQYLSKTGIFLARWPLPETPAFQVHVSAQSLTPKDQGTILAELDDTFVRLKKEMGMQSRDLIVLYPDLAGLEGMLDKFSACHTHDDEEVRYIIDGEGIFGLVLPEGDQALLTVEAGDFIRIPAGTEHWFILTSKKRIKAVRYFSDTAGWVPRYTGTTILLR